MKALQVGLSCGTVYNANAVKEGFTVSLCGRGGGGQVITNSNENTGSAACLCLPAATEKCLSPIVVNL